MRRLLLTSGILLGCALPATAEAAVHAHYGMRLSRCHHAVDPSNRSFHLDGAMRRVPGTQLMAIKVQLQVRLHGRRIWHPYTTYFSPETALYGTWIPSAKRADRYVFARTVNDLQGPPTRSGRHRPLSLRIRAAFRWYGAGHKVLLTRHVTTGACYQPELRPNLHVLGLTWRVTPLGATGYAAAVTNRGASTAAPFDLELSDAQGTLTKPVFGGLAPRATVHRFFPAATCDPTATLVADPDGTVDESNENDDKATVVCP